MAKKKDTDQSNEEMKIVYRRLGTIKPLPGNAKLHDLPGIIKGIADHGFVDPILVSTRTMHNLDGNGRWEALTQMHAEGGAAPAGVIASNGHWLVPTLDKDCDEQTERILALSLNRLNEKGGYDPAAVLAILNEANTLGRLEQTGYDNDAVFGLLAQCTNVDYSNGNGVSPTYTSEPADASPQIDRAAELNEKWKVKTGDIWLVGDHRLLCGDSTKTEDVAHVMNGRVAALGFTSPPYAEMRDYAPGTDVSVKYLTNFLPACAPYVELLAVNLGLQMRDNEVVDYWSEYLASARLAGFKLLSWSVWDRGQAGTISQNTAFIPIHHEWIFIFGISRKDIKRTLPLASATIERREGYQRTESGQRLVPVRQKDGGFEMTTTKEHFAKKIGTVCHVPPYLVREGVAHPAMFPVALPSHYIEPMTERGDVVYEPFCGAGSTMVAAENTGRNCYGVEIDQNACAVTLERMANAFPHLEIRKA